MNISIATKNITLDEPLRVFVDEKIGGLEKFMGSGADTAQARVEIGRSTRHHHKGSIFYAEANITLEGEFLRAQIEREDLRVAITEVKDDLQRQIKRYREKRRA